MLHKISTLFLLTLFVSSISSCYDDSLLQGQVDEIEKRVSTLETIIKAQSTNDAITSIIEIDSGYMITFKNAGIITLRNGRNGTPGDKGERGDAFFSSVTISENAVTIVLTDGQTFELPLYSALDISFTGDMTTPISPNETRIIDYSIESRIESISIEVLTEGKVHASILAEGKKNGSIKISTGESIDEFAKIVIIVGNGEKIIIRSLTHLLNTGK